MVDGSQRVEFEDVVVVRRTGLVVMCRVGPRVVGVPTRCMLPGTTISGTADRCRLVLPREDAINIGLV